MGSELVANVRYALRSFAKRPVFTAAILVTIALGIGSNVAIFSVANAILFRPLPYESPEELVLVWTRLPATDVARGLVSPPDFQDYQTGSTLFEGLAAAMAIPSTATGVGPAEQIIAAFPTWNFFDLLGVAPMLGRGFNADDAFEMDPSMLTSPTASFPPAKVVLSHGFWQRRFGGDPSVVGGSIELNGLPSEIIGVLPPDFQIYMPPDSPIPTEIEAWSPMPSNMSDFGRDAPMLAVIGRLRPGATAEQAQSEMDAVAARLRETYQTHANQNMQILVNDMHGDVVEHTRPTLLALLGAAAFVLLIACANVANLLLVRATGRGREIAVRAALGSGRGRIVAQMLTESALLAVVGGALGLLLARVGMGVIAGLSPGNLPRIDEVGIDGPVLVFTVVATLAAALIFGIAPALHTLGGNLAASLKDRGASSGGAGGNRLRTGLVVVEVALSMVLLVGAGLMLRSFAELQAVDPGFETENIITFTVPVPFATYLLSADRAAFASDLRDRISELPGVASVGAIAPLPLARNDLYNVGPYGAAGVSDEEYRANRADFKVVVSGFFETLDIEIVAGRAFERSDEQAESRRVVIIDERVAANAFGDEDPIGRELMIDTFNEQTFAVERSSAQVVGVVRPIRTTSLAVEGRETIYAPYIMAAFLPPTFVVRTQSDPGAIVASVREAVAAMDPGVPVAEIATLESYVTDAMAQTRFMLWLIGTFAVVALVLASLGLYGVISYSVRQRTREIGVRVAFGAGDRDVIGLVLRQGLVVTGAGIAAGAAASLLATRVVESFLVGVGARDPVTFVAIPLILLTVALVAGYVPARRAAAVDPVVALGDE